MSPLDVGTAALILGLGATLQTAVGFGMGLFAVPLLVAAGHPLSNAVAILLGASVMQNVIAAFSARAHVSWRLSLSIAPLQWLGQPVGVAALAALQAAGSDTVEQVVGALVLALLAARLVIRPAPRARVPWVVGAAAAGSSGFLGGLVGMGGPPLVFFALAHDWTQERFRAFLWTQFLLGAPVLLTALVLRLGTGILVSWGVGAACLPVVWLGARAGLALTHGWDAERARRAATLLLTAVGFASVVRPIL